jgi:DNA-binding response OmpR family regulator
MANILVVDDNDKLLEVCNEILRHVGHEVTTAANGKEALRLVQTNPFDLVITDLVMPEKEGIETIRELRRQFSTIKIIAMSGGGRVDPEDYLVIARQLGASQTLIKPFSARALMEAVSTVLQGTA